MRKILFTIFSVVILFTSCTKESSPVNILVSRYGEDTIVQAGSLVSFHIRTFSEKSTVKKVSVSSLESENGTLHLWDTLLDIKAAEFDYVYKAPFYTQNEETKVQLTFTATSNEGEETKMTVSIIVSKGGALTAYDGVIMYSALSSDRNGFNLSMAQTLYTATADSTNVDIYDYFNPDNTDSTMLGCEWRSKTGVLFVRYNDFNFTGATISSLHYAYEAGAKYTSIPNLQTGDIILVGRGANEIGAIQITAIYDDEGTVSDRYIFNFKKK